MRVSMQVSAQVERLVRALASVTCVYLVGGTVRALFTGEEVKDMDLAVEDFDAAVEALRMHGFSVSEEARSFRVVKVFLGDQVVDVAGFRTETYDMVSRKPVTAPARSMFEDASRRDFTFNAMYARVASVYHGALELEVEDPFGGLQDLERRVVRAVGDARVRFMEDPLRMLRAVRFAVLLHDVGKPDTVTVRDDKVTFPGHESVSAEMAEAWLRAMRFPNRVVHAVRSAVEHHMRVHRLAEAMSRRAMARLLLDLGESPSLVELTLRVAEADAGTRYTELRAALAEMLSLPRLVTGSDVLSYPERLRGPLLRLAREVQLAQGVRDRDQMLRLLRGLTVPKAMLPAST